ncbi:MAG: glycoside hydrolase family 3 protein [Alphaproteobacteria bacterium]|nr:glycoside hydrolase family 3 protein [Alphaproteobacteria bacterium]
MDRNPKAVIFGCSGSVLSAEEAAFFRDADPVGFILFGRNCETPEQVEQLVTDLRASVGRADAPVLIDQEGGRVARLRPPHWPRYPAAKRFGDLAIEEGLDHAVAAVRANSRLIGQDLAALGITVNCAPAVDVPVPGAHDMIGDRAFGRDPDLVTALGRASCDGYLSAGVMPVVKHLLGYGRAFVDSHLDLPRIDTPLDVLAATDFLPFKALLDLPWAMTAHALYPALDPDLPLTISPRIVQGIIRGKFGYDGIIVTDDICMEALPGAVEDRAVAALEAGCDLACHCSGKLDEMRAIDARVGRAPDRLVEKLAAGEVFRKDHRRDDAPGEGEAARRLIDSLLPALA